MDRARDLGRSGDGGHQSSMIYPIVLCEHDCMSNTCGNVVEPVISATSTISHVKTRKEIGNLTKLRNGHCRVTMRFLKPRLVDLART